MSKNKVATIFNKLSKGISPPPMVDKTDINAANPSDAQMAVLQKQQAMFLQKQWQRLERMINQNNLYVETTRYASYLQYERMEQYPVIGAALQLYMNETCTLNEKGQVLNIYSDNPNTKKILEDLFYNRLSIQTNLPAWTKTTCKYGDCFVHWQVSEKDGILGAKMLPTAQVERQEMPYHQMVAVGSYDDQERHTIFKWCYGDTITFKWWQIGHFRLLFDDKKVPYGQSMLERARRTWSNLIIVEDAMRAIRLMRAMDRRIFYVNVGNINQDDVQPFIEGIADRFKRKMKVDPETGQIDLKYNIMDIDQDFVIPIRGSNDGSKIESLAGASNLGEIADIEYEFRQLFTALGIPKPFLNYDEASGDGKALSSQDIRMAKMIMRIQQAMLMELQQVAMVHLFLLGMEDEIYNFKLSMNAPSLAEQGARVELAQAKMNLYKDYVGDPGNGIAPMSSTRAKMELLGMTPDEIRLDLEQQRIERAVAEELKNTPQNIPKTGIFDNIDALYAATTEQVKVEGDSGNAENDEGSGGGGDDMGGFGGSGGGGGFDFGGGDLGGSDLGGEEGDLGGAVDDALANDLEDGGDVGSEGGGGSESPAPENASFYREGRILKEWKERLLRLNGQHIYKK